MRTSSAARQFVAWASLAALLIVLLPAISTAQEPVRAFDQLNTRLKVGDTIYVTDAQGHEIKGQIQAFGNDALTLEHVVTSRLGSGKAQVVAAADVRLVQQEERDSLANGTLIGLGIGALGGMLLGAAQNDFSSEEALFGAVVFGGIGALGGLGVDYAMGHHRVVVYRAQGTTATASVRLSLAPVITPRTKGVVVSYSF